MSKSISRVLCGLFIATSMTVAPAEDRPWYVTLDAGVPSAGDPAFAGGRLTTRLGAAYGGAIGRQLGSHWRVEAALMYRNNPVRRVSSPGFDPQPADADCESVVDETADAVASSTNFFASANSPSLRASKVT